MRNLIIFILVFVFFQSCTDCKRDTKTAYNDECNLVVEIPPSEYPYLFKTTGYDPVTKEMKICHNDSRWWSLYIKEIEVGDTIVKKKGELTFYIHKKDTIIAHDWVCYDGDGKHVYFDQFAKQLKQIKKNQLKSQNHITMIKKLEVTT